MPSKLRLAGSGIAFWVTLTLSRPYSAGTSRPLNESTVDVLVEVTVNEYTVNGNSAAFTKTLPGMTLPPQETLKSLAESVSLCTNSS